jgi:DNA-binding transcriptional LysR family regulator
MMSGIHTMNEPGVPPVDPLLAGLDLNLLRIAAALHETGSVTVAARRLGLTQAAASNALARLRRACGGDPLFLRAAQGMTPTAQGERLGRAAAAALAAVAESIAAPASFDPATSTRRFTLRMTDIGEVVFLPTLLAELAAHAPAASLRTVALSSGDTPAALARGEVDLAIGFLPELREGWYQQRLFEQRYVVLRRAGPPGALTRAAYLRGAHLAIESPGTGHLIVERALRAQGVRRRVALQVPDFLAAVMLVARTDLMCTVPAKLAQAAAESLPVQSSAVPVELPGFAIHQYWHPRAHPDAAVRWLRERIAARFAEPPAARPRGRRATGANR